ncbi:MAG: NAD-dependent epimerase/dehydratase family protein [bacterium]|nr:NAD-dependent epimerase/dehydratase family protein [bacterium]
MKNVLIEGVATPLGERIAEGLSHRPGVERIVGIDPDSDSTLHSQVELIAFEPNHHEQFEFMREHEIDTVIQGTLAPDRMGEPFAPRAADVIGTMRVGAAVAHPGCPVRSWVVLSSSAAYPINEDRPLLNREANETLDRDDEVHGRLLEAEEYAAAVARRVPHLNVAILRMQEVIGEEIRGPLARHFAQGYVPNVIGHDALIQFLHVEDAIDAVTLAAKLELAGIYNVASRGVIRESEFLEAASRSDIPVLPLEAGMFAPLARTFGIPHIAEGILPTLRFGHALDTTKIEGAGFKPLADQFDCAAVLRD